MKNLIRQLLRQFGYDIRRFDPRTLVPGSNGRPIGDLHGFFQDIVARGFSPAGIIDVGANVGDWTRLAKTFFPQARVLMIEPQIEMKERLETLCREAGGVEWVHAGAGKETGTLVQTIWEDLAGSSFLPEPDEEKIRRGKQRLTPIVTIDDLLKERPGFPPDLVKLDIQGFELEALKGGTSLFGRTELFILETSLFRFFKDAPTTADCVAFMDQRDYVLYDVLEYGRRPLDGALGQIDLAFAKRRGQFRASEEWGS